MLNEVAHRQAGECADLSSGLVPIVHVLDVFGFPVLEVVLHTLACHSAQSGFFRSSPAVFDLANVLAAILSQESVRRLAVSQVSQGLRCHVLHTSHLWVAWQGALHLGRVLGLLLSAGQAFEAEERVSHWQACSRNKSCLLTASR